MKAPLKSVAIVVLTLMLICGPAGAGYRAESTAGGVRIPGETEDAVVSINCLRDTCRLEVVYTIRVNGDVAHIVYVPMKDDNYLAGTPILFGEGDERYRKMERIKQIDSHGPVVVFEEGEKIAFTATAGKGEDKFSVLATIKSADIPTLSPANLKARVSLTKIPLALYVAQGRAGRFHQVVASPDGYVFLLYVEENVLKETVSPDDSEQMLTTDIEDLQRLVQVWRVSDDGLGGSPILLAENNIEGVFMDKDSKIVPGRNGSLTVVVKGVERAFRFDSEMQEWTELPRRY